MAPQRRKKNGFQKRAKVYGKAGKQLYKDVMYLKSLVNSELHYTYGTYTGQAISSSGSVFHLSAIPQDDTNYGRSGNSVMPRYLSVIVNLLAQEVDTVRLLIFRWKDNSTPTISDLFENPSVPVYSPMNDNITGNARDRKIDIIKSKLMLMDKTDRDGFLYKKTFDLNPPAKQIKDHVRFDDTATTAPLGGIYMVLVGRQPTLTTNFDGMHKLSFHDN